MTSSILVCPYDEGLLSRLRGASVVVETSDMEAVRMIADRVGHLPIRLHCLLLRTDMPLASVPVSEQWRGIPLALHAPGLGRFRDVLRMLPLLRQLNLRLYLPLHDRLNYAAVRLLASVGIAAAVRLPDDGQEIDWTLLSELMTYALLGFVPHAPVEPFEYLAAEYDPGKRTDYGAVYFEDPERYLHVDKTGRVALSSRGAAAGDFIGTIEDLAALTSLAAYRDGVERWRNVFLEADGCACCPGWRVCLGKFSQNSDRGCKTFFTEAIGTIEQYRSRQEGNKPVWRP